MGLPNVPDDIFRILLVIGLFLIGYGSINLDNVLDKKLQIAEEEIDTSINSLIVKKEQVFELEQLLEKSQAYEKRVNLPPLFVFENSVPKLHPNILKSTTPRWIIDTALSLLKLYSHNNLERNLDSIRSTRRQEVYKSQETILKAKEDLYKSYMTIGFILFLIGLCKLFITQNQKDRLLSWKVNSKSKQYLFCQSCGKKFSSIRVHGDAVDGTSNAAFCSKCYSKGVFIEPNLIRTEQIERAKIEKREKGLIVSDSIIEKRINSLERWRTNEY